MDVDLYYFIILDHFFLSGNQIFHLFGVANRSIGTYGSEIEFYTAQAHYTWSDAR